MGTGSAADNASPDALSAARADLGATFSDLAARNTLQPDQQLATHIQTLAGNVMRYVPESQRGPIVARIEDAVSGMQTGTMSGRAYAEMDSALGKAIRGTTDGHTRNHLGELRDTLRGAMDRSITPKDQAAWQEVRGRYAALIQIGKAMDRPSERTALGNVSPAALASATRNAPSKSFVFGRGNVDDLARSGQGALKQTVGNSGTPQRTMIGNLLQGGNLPSAGAFVSGQNPLMSLALPATTIGMPYVAARAYHSNVMRNYLTNNRVSGMTPTPNGMLTLGLGEQNAMDRLRDR